MINAISFKSTDNPYKNKINIPTEMPCDSSNQGRNASLYSIAISEAAGAQAKIDSAEYTKQQAQSLEAIATALAKIAEKQEDTQSQKEPF